MAKAKSKKTECGICNKPFADVNRHKKRIHKTDQQPKQELEGGYFVFKYKGEEQKIRLQQKAFVDAYLRNRGNRVDAYYAAGYQAKNRLVASAAAARLLKNVNVQNYVNSRLVEHGYDDDNAILQLLFLMNQHAELNNKAKGLDMFFKIKGKYEATKHQHEFGGVNSDELTKRLAQLLAEIARGDEDSGGA